MSKLKLSAVSKTYGATAALRRGDLEVEAGEVHVLIGSNGSGKSTLCKIAAGSVRPDKGAVTIDGATVAISGPQGARALGIGAFYQELSLAAHRSVEENICLPDLPMKAGLFVDRAALSARAQTYISLFEGVAGDGFSADAVVGDLRADQRQLVEIMKTIATEAPILIFDEPTSALDRAQVTRFFEILARLKAEGRAMIFISHRMDEIFSIGDRVTVIRDGETVGTWKIAETDHAAVIGHMIGETQRAAQSATTEPTQTEARVGDVLLSVRGLAGPGYSGIDFEVRKGEVLGFGGLHGQGQSRVLRAIFGDHSVTGGAIVLEGEALTTRSPRAAIQRGLAYVSGDRSRDGILKGRPIIENLTPIHYLLNKLVLARPAALRERATPAVEALRTKFESFGHPIDSLSGGNQQKIVIARWLIDKPDVLLLDDPTKGIDLSAKADLYALIGKLAAEGMGIVLYSSDDAELLANAHRILVFNGGRVTRTLEGADRTQFNLYQAAYEAA